MKATFVQRPDAGTYALMSPAARAKLVIEANVARTTVLALVVPMVNDVDRVGVKMTPAPA